MAAQVAVAAVALLTALAIHEAAHAVALRSYGIRIIRAGLGIPLPPTFRVRWPARTRITLTFSPWLVGAYVEPDSDDQPKLDALPYRDQAWYLNAGIIANFVSGFVVIAVLDAAAGRWVAASVLAAAAVLTAMFRRAVGAYILPALAVPALVLLGYALASSWAAGETGAGMAGVPSLVEPGSTGAVRFFGVISLTLAIVNAVPLFGLDNGKVVGLVLDRWVGRRGRSVYRIGGGVSVAALLALSVGSDPWALAQAVL
jgi:membrane-associated protease RseP (regulator of RpoE activity)